MPIENQLNASVHIKHKMFFSVVIIDLTKIQSSRSAFTHYDFILCPFLVC